MELKRLVKLAIPLSIYYLTEVMMGVTDMIIVGRLGSTELAAVGLTANVVIEMLLVCFGILSMVGVLSSNALGAGDRAQVSRVVGQGFWLALMLAVLAIGIGLFIPDLFVATGQDPDVVRLSRDYLAWFLWIVPFALLFVVLRNFLTVLSRAGVVAIVTIPAVGLNLALNYLFVFGKLGFPAMGVAGAGLASVIVNVVLLLSLLLYVRFNAFCRPYRLLASVRQFHPSIILNIVRLGTPAGMGALLEGGLFVVVGIMMGTLGAAWLAANEILFHIIPFAFVMALSIGEAAAVRIAFHAGARNYQLTRWVARTALITGCSIMLASALVLWFLPGLVIGMFMEINDPENAEVVEITLSLIRIAAVFQLFDGLQVVTLWCLRGLKDTLVPMWIATAGYWVCGLGSGYVLGFVLGFGAQGVWVGLATGLIVTSLLLAMRLRALFVRQQT